MVGEPKTHREKMNKQIVGIIMGIFLISLVSALDLQAGESYSFDIAEEFVYYSIVGNSTEIDLNVIQEGTNVTITAGKYVNTDSFEMIFFNNEKEIITLYQSSGGSSGGTRTVYKDNNITQYVDKNIVEYVDREIQGEKETIFETVIINESNFWYYFIMGILVCIIIFLYFFLKTDKKDYIETPIENYVESEVKENDKTEM